MRQCAYLAGRPPALNASVRSLVNCGIARASAMMCVGFRSWRADSVAVKREIEGPETVVRRRFEVLKRERRSQAKV